MRCRRLQNESEQRAGRADAGEAIRDRGERPDQYHAVRGDGLQRQTEGLHHGHCQCGYDGMEPCAAARAVAAGPDGEMVDGIRGADGGLDRLQCAGAWLLDERVFPLCLQLLRCTTCGSRFADHDSGRGSDHCRIRRPRGLSGCEQIFRRETTDGLSRHRLPRRSGQS